MALGDKEYKKVLEQSKILPESDPRTKLVRRVGQDLAAVAEKPDFKWEFNVIDDDKTINAFCLPGGKVAVYTGIMAVAKTNDQLATVMGHEIGHALARHGGERISQGLLTQLGGSVVMAAVGGKDPKAQKAVAQAYGTGAQVGVLLPFSRKHEEEADYIGLILMAKAGHEPKAAKEFWENMDKTSSEKKGKDDPLAKFLSTHPSHGKRIENIAKWLPEADGYYQKSRKN
ncbi:MAG: M48 family metallopeptidase [Elusimicrobia bacterium]|nr:M48 family metallopeptidase [Elusimicrobiota bacterium]